jgi:hypothetical protein
MTIMQLIDMTDEKGLRALRLHHWRQVLKASKSMAKQSEALETATGHNHRYHTRMYTIERKRWSEHMGYVQLLNTFFSIDDTAEKDAAK